MFKDKYQEISFENSAEIMKMTMDSAHRMEMGPYYMYRQKNMAGNFENVGYSREGKAGIYNILIMEENSPFWLQEPEHPRNSCLTTESALSGWKM